VSGEGLLPDDLRLERDGGGRFRAVWTPLDAGPLQIGWGASPEATDHTVVGATDSARGEAELPGGQPSLRPYVSLRPLGSDPADGPVAVAGERRLPFAGPVNFRDIGGYRSADGRRVRWGRLYRSDLLVFEPEDAPVYRELGIRTVYDLRSTKEQELSSNVLPVDPPGGSVALPLVSEQPELNPVAGIETSDGGSFLRHLYRNILDRSAHNFGTLLTGMADPEKVPAVFHCAAGKDRTGLLAAVLLGVLGVPIDDILDDYELTALYRRAEHVAESAQRFGENFKMPPEVVAGMLDSPRWALSQALQDLVAHPGGFDAYLTGPAGADPSLPDRLRDALLEG
jgi:protein-tyrosine phosphatase